MMQSQGRFRENADARTRWEVAVLAAETTLALKSAMTALYSLEQGDTQDFRRYVTELNDRAENIWSVYKRLSGQGDE